MDEGKRKLTGSKAHDIFKQKHKELACWFYACDADLVLVSKHPPGTVAYLDYKMSDDCVTFSEALQYNEWMKTAPVYIVWSDYPKTGPFRIDRYLGGNWRPEPPEVTLEYECDCETWTDFEEWERTLRQTYTNVGGWQGRLRT